MEPIKVNVSHVRTHQVLVWKSAAWAIDEEGTIYHRHLLDDNMIWSPVEPEFLADDVYQHMLTGIEVINNLYT